ncbi:MAG: hypothetical protein J2P35_13290, partial [Actinobacteria bacterium]|nr:hypothetical protein [Actinomycetota bacterium]
MTGGTSAVVVPAVPPGSHRAQRSLAGVALPAVAVGVAVAGLRAGTGPITAVYAVGTVLVTAWALAAVCWAWSRPRAAAWQLAAGTLAGAVTLAAARL